MYVVKGLDTHLLTPQLLRDIYPYARAFAPESMREIFEIAIADMKHHAPKLYKAMTKGDDE